MKTLQERFWSKVIKGRPNECWLWAGCTADGYGRILIGSRRDGSRRSERASRIALEIKLGRPLISGMLALHDCPGGDNPACVNPRHLYEGTYSANMYDMHSKNRHPRGGAHKGELHHLAKLSNEDILEIRYRYAQGDISQQALGEEFDVSQSQISRIVRGVGWKESKGLT